MWGPSNLAVLLGSIYPLDTLAKVHLDICEYTFTYTHTHIKIATAIWNSKKNWKTTRVNWEKTDLIIAHLYNRKSAVGWGGKYIICITKWKKQDEIWEYSSSCFVLLYTICITKWKKARWDLGVFFLFCTFIYNIYLIYSIYFYIFFLTQHTLILIMIT